MAVIKGTAKADTKNGTSSADTIYGYGGNDTLSGRAGDDQIWGGKGNDKMYGEAGNDFLRGEDGNDTGYGGAGNDVVYGGNGDDSLYGDAGTDTVKGDAGNDIIKGGIGISYLYGGAGNDSLYYDPTTENISKVKGYLAGSIIDGDAGSDTLNITNEATYTSGTMTKAALTKVDMSGLKEGDIYFTNAAYQYSNKYESSDVGHFQEVEKIIVTGSGKLEFTGSYSSGKGIDITGTAGNDVFHSYSASDTMRGGGGNDEFHVNGGNDVIGSGTNDSDKIYFTGSVNATINGFNGAGAFGGDVIYFDVASGAEAPTITEEDGKTKFELQSEYSGEMIVTVDKVGLEEAVDYFFT